MREFLKRNELHDKISCLVTFWGVPLRIGRRSLSSQETRELADLKAQQEQTRSVAEQQVKSLEDLAVRLDPSIHAAGGGDIESLSRRADAAISDRCRSGTINRRSEKARGSGRRAAAICSAAWRATGSCRAYVAARLFSHRTKASG